MPLMQKPSPQIRKVKFSLRIEDPLLRMVHQYAEFIHAHNDYVITEALKYFFDRDTDFKAWLVEHPLSAAQPQRRPRQKANGTGAALEARAREHASARSTI